jgi:hypothetical protein
MPFSQTNKVAGPGRPIGSKNKKVHLSEVLLNVSKATKHITIDQRLSPMELLLRWANDIRLDYPTRIYCAEVLMPYTERRKPVEIEQKTTGTVQHGLTVQFVTEQPPTYDMLPGDEPAKSLETDEKRIVYPLRSIVTR